MSKLWTREKTQWEPSFPNLKFSLGKENSHRWRYSKGYNVDTDVVTHRGCTEVGIFDHSEITVSLPFGTHCGGQVGVGAKVWT
jgi:hypothetical protein